MSLRPDPFAALPLGLAACVVPFAIWLARLPSFSGQRALILAHVAMLWWLVFVALEIASPGAPCKLFYGSLVHGGITLLPIAWLAFVIRFTSGASHPGRLWQDRAMLVAPIAVVLIAMTSEWHGLFYTDGSVLVGTGGRTRMAYAWGPLFIAISVALYACILTAVVLLARAMVVAGAAQRYHFGALLVLTLLPTVANLAYLAGWVNMSGYDPTPFVFAVAIILYVQLLLTDRTFDVASIARQHLFERMPLPVVILSADRKVCSRNTAASTLFESAASLPEVDHAISTLARTGARAESCTLAGVRVADRVCDAMFEPLLPPLGRRDRPLGWIVVLDDVTVEHQRQEHLSRLTEESETARRAAERDPLTGLYNRRTLETKFEDATVGAKNTGRPLFCALIDIDHFKAINDTLGHAVGDVALKRLADVLQNSFRADDHIVRLGGEEFLILFEGPDRLALQQRLNRARSGLLIAKAIDGSSTVPAIRFSAGIAEWPRDGKTLDALIAIADRRLYKAKSAGRDRIMVDG